MRLLISIPKEFEQHFQADRFEDSLHRLSADAHLLAGNYERETAAMLVEAFKNAIPVPPGRLINADEIIKKIKAEGINQAKYYANRRDPVVPKTNADCLRSMSDEELAKWFAPTDNGLKPCPKDARWPKSCERGCGNCWLDWLRQEAITGVDQGEEDIAAQEYQAATEYQEHCERYEPTYNPEDGSM